MKIGKSDDDERRAPITVTKKGIPLIAGAERGPQRGKRHEGLGKSIRATNWAKPLTPRVLDQRKNVYQAQRRKRLRSKGSTMRVIPGSREES